MGRAGSVISDLLLQVVGLTAFGLVLLFAIFAFLKVEEEIEESSRSTKVYFLLFVFSVSCLFQAHFPKSLLPFQMVNAGGLIGEGLANGLTFFTGTFGCKLISVFLSLASAILLFRIRIISNSVKILRALYFKFKTQVPVLQVWIAKQHVTYKEWLATKRKPKAPPIQVPIPVEPAQVFETPAPLPAQEAVAMQPELIGMEQGYGPQVSFGPSEDDQELVRAVAPGKQTEVKSQKPKPVRKPGQPFSLPQLAILSGKADSKSKTVEKSWYVEKANILVEKLRDFGVEGEVTNISPGPVITVYEFKPASGVKIKDIANLSDDLTLALSVLSVRIVAPIPGKPVVGIEIPSPHRETVFFKDLIQETPFFNEDIRIPIALGRLASGEPVTADLAAMPHLLVAGTTGTGKSVFINTLITSLLYRFGPDQMKLILVDPKMVELSLYEGIPHLLLPVVVDSKKAALALRWAVDEMERRYTAMHQFGVRHIGAYNERLLELQKKGQVPDGAESLPYIVVVIDEYADLMAVVPKDVETSIARLAQKARASGIHLVLATQRPSTDVVTGIIKANFPSRISFRVASAVDSKTILDRTGADRLLGHGDMLFHTAGFSTLKRMQGSFISDADIARIVEFLKMQASPNYDERMMASLEQPDTDGTFQLDGSEANDDEGRLYDAAVRIVTEKGEASISLIQRHLRIGYNRAAMLVEQMEKEGVLAPATGTSKRRAVLVNSI